VESALSDTAVALKKAQDALAAAYNRYCKMKTYIESCHYIQGALSMDEGGD